MNLAATDQNCTLSELTKLLQTKEYEQTKPPALANTVRTKDCNNQNSTNEDSWQFLMVRTGADMGGQTGKHRQQTTEKGRQKTRTGERADERAAGGTTNKRTGRQTKWKRPCKVRRTTSKKHIFRT